MPHLTDYIGTSKCLMLASVLLIGACSSASDSPTSSAGSNQTLTTSGSTPETVISSNFVTDNNASSNSEANNTANNNGASTTTVNNTAGNGATTEVNQPVSSPTTSNEQTANEPVANTQQPPARTTTRVNFEITVPAYVSNALKVEVIWGERVLTAQWVVDESWVVSDDLPMNTEDFLEVTFSDGNGALTLATVFNTLETGSANSQLVTITEADFDTEAWDDDVDGVTNLAEVIAGTNPLVVNFIEPVEPTLDLIADKTFRIRWDPTIGAQFYRILENADGMSGFTQIGEDLDSLALLYDHRVALYKRMNARYIVQACNVVACVDSEELVVTGSMVGAIGYLKASNAEAYDKFGASLAMNADGTVLAVGATLEDSGAAGVNGIQDNNARSDTGAVYIFGRINNGVNSRWEQQAYLKASNPDRDDKFGASIDLSADGSTLAVGAVGEDSSATGINTNQGDNSVLDAGAVYVFTNNNGQWQQQAYVKASNSGIRDAFGSRVGLSGNGDTLAVSASGEDSASVGINGNEGDNSATFSGAVYVFVRLNNTWQQQSYIKASNTDASDAFGSSLGISDDGSVIAIGAYTEQSNATGINGNQSNNDASAAGAVYIFGSSNGNWQQHAYIKASNTDGPALFGRNLGLSADGKTLAVGAIIESSAATGINGNQNDRSTLNAGAVYVYTNSSTVNSSGGVWQQQAYVKASNTELNDYFGWSVSLSGDGNTMVVGSWGESSAAVGIGGNQFDNSLEFAGAAYVFERASGNWQQQAYLKASNTATNAEFGVVNRLSDDGSTLAVSAVRENNAATGINGNQNSGTLEDSGAVYLF